MAGSVDAPSMAAPTGLAHRMRLASALQSQAGRGLVASGAMRLSRRQASWRLVTLILRSHLVRDDFLRTSSRSISLAEHDLVPKTGIHFSGSCSPAQTHAPPAC